MGMDPAHATHVLGTGNLHAMREITQLRDTADPLAGRARALAEESRRDPPTGAYDRGDLERYLSREFEQASRDDRPRSIECGDLDGFRKVDQADGHPAGDPVLKTPPRS